MFLCNWHVFRKPSTCHALWKTPKFKLLYFRNEARYRAENMQKYILKPLVADRDKNSKGSLVLYFIFLWRHVQTKNWGRLKAAKYEIQKPSTWRATLFRCKFGSMFPVFHLAWSTCRATKTFVAGWRKLLRKVERGSTLSNKFWLCCSFFIKLTTCRATNVLVY